MPTTQIQSSASGAQNQVLQNIITNTHATQIQSSASGAQNQVLQNITDMMPSYPNTSTLNSLKFNIRPLFVLQSRCCDKVACMACAMRAH